MEIIFLIVILLIMVVGISIRGKAIQNFIDQLTKKDDK